MSTPPDFILIIHHGIFISFLKNRILNTLQTLLEVAAKIIIEKALLTFNFENI
jgi:hypothetical protein